MPKSRQDRSSHFSMGEDVYLLSKSAVSLNFDDHDGEIFRGNLPANAASYEATPKTTTNVKGFVASQHGHNRWSSVTTVLGLSSLFGPSNDSSRNGIATPTSSRRKRPRRVRIKGIYGFLLHNDFLEETNMILIFCYLMVLLFSILICIGPIILTNVISKDEWCGISLDTFGGDDNNRQWFSGDTTISDTNSNSPYANPDYILDPCRYFRVVHLCYLTLEECDMCRRLLCSVLFGGIIGYERRSADRPAGIRTMGLVSLGACSFTISSIMAFKSSTMGWDASRVTAALPSGVGFLGGALIWKGSIFINDEEIHQVNGLTTAASVWLSAAVGVGCGGALYLVTGYVVILVVIILRYAPRSYFKGLINASTDMEEEDEEEEEEETAPTDKEPIPQYQNESQLAERRRVSRQVYDGNDIEEDEILDKVASMRASSRGLDEFDSRLKRSASKSMIKSKSTDSLRKSLRDQFPTFGE